MWGSPYLIGVSDFFTKHSQLIERKRVWRGTLNARKVCRISGPFSGSAIL